MRSTSLARRKLKYVATINDEALGEDTDAHFQMQYVDISNVDSSGQIGDLAAYRFEDAPSRARRLVRDGDVIISTVRTYLQAIAQISNPPANLIVSTGFAVVRPRPTEFDPRYCKYALREPAFLAEMESRSVGVSYPAINASDLASIPVHIHPLPQQRAIADYLDRETARIDSLIAAKQRVLQLLNEKRRALIARAVTRGLDPHTPLRDSGIPWLGEIPAHWEVWRSKRLFSLRNQRAPVGVQQLTASQDYGVIPQSEFVEREGRRVVEVDKGTDILKQVEENDFVISMRSFQGGIELSRHSGSISSAYVVLTPTSKVFVPFFSRLLKCSMFVQALRSTSSLIRDGQALRYENFTLVDLPLPPHKEQQQIAAYLDEQLNQLGKVAVGSERTVGLLKERRSALIAAAVTGQVPVA